MRLAGMHRIGKSYGARSILSDLSFAIEEGDRIGIIGQNGSGKSTLLRLLAGLEQPDSGEIALRRGLVLAHLPQHPLGDERGALETVLTARPDLVELERELTECGERLGEPDVIADLSRMERVLRRQDALLERYEAAGGPGFSGRAQVALDRVGLTTEECALQTSRLSGGKRKLVALAWCLARSPDLLLLDEPEAHLDAGGRTLLEELVTGFGGAIAMISHDRHLLDATVGQIASLDRGRIRLWPGNYSAYTLARELELRRQQTLYAAQAKEIERLEQAIARFRLWASLVVNEGHIKQARNKQRQLDRMERVERPVLERRRIGLELRPAVRGGRRVAELRAVTVAFGDDPVLLGADLSVLSGERVGIVGENGAGKSVLVKTLAGELEPLEGEVWIGPSIELGYLAQDQETLPPELSPLETLRSAFPLAENEAVSALMRFLFPYEQVRKPNASLSGGERTRLQLLLLMLARPNLLVLDEPTNHLDIDSVEVLEDAIERFAGTVCVISHDRYFLERIADRIVEVRDGRVRSFEGGYGDWLRRRPLASGAGRSA